MLNTKLTWYIQWWLVYTTFLSVLVLNKIHHSYSVKMNSFFAPWWWMSLRAISYTSVCDYEWLFLKSLSSFQKHILLWSDMISFISLPESFGETPSSQNRIVAGPQQQQAGGWALHRRRFGPSILRHRRDPRKWKCCTRCQYRTRRISPLR